MKSVTSLTFAAVLATSAMTVGSAFAAPAAKTAKASMSNADYRARHAQALDLALRGNTKSAVTMLNKLADDPKISQAEKDRVNLSIGRINYQDGFDDAALEAYLKISKGSPSWLEALEERAWVEMRLGKPEKTIATLKTVLLPVFKDQIHSESYFTMALAQLRVCDYRTMYKTVDKFKKTYRPKIASWEMSNDLQSKSFLQEVSDTIQKVNLVEAEAIQHLHLSESGKRQGGSVPTIARTVDELSFPETDGDEVWVGELDATQVRTKGCPTSDSFSPNKKMLTQTDAKGTL